MVIIYAGKVAEVEVTKFDRFAADWKMEAVLSRELHRNLYHFVKS